MRRNDRGCVVHNRSSGARVSFIMYEDECMMIVMSSSPQEFIDTSSRTEDEGILRRAPVGRDCFGWF